MLKNSVLLILVVLLFGCSQDQPTQVTAQPTPATNIKSVQNSPEVAENLLVFFINPDGGPCRMQADILNQMSEEFAGKVLVRPVKTTIKADMDIFYAYGIRALPTILLADSSGKEITRLPPGVHAADTIRGLLKQIPGK
ncbi:MAG: thioredoxin domain-containing protein [Desulfuromusa sp.]